MEIGQHFNSFMCIHYPSPLKLLLEKFIEFLLGWTCEDYTEILYLDISNYTANYQLVHRLLEIMHYCLPLFMIFFRVGIIDIYGIRIQNK